MKSRRKNTMVTWTFDPAHTAAEFTARHMMVTTVRGKITGVSGTLEFDPAHPEKGSVEVTLDAASIYTGVGQRDDHLRSPDFLDVANYPHITFKSTKVEVTGKNTGKVTGDLTIRGVTRPVVLDVEFLGTETDPWQKSTRVGFEATAKINREDWGLTWNVALESGGVLVSKEVKLAISVEAIQAQQVAAETAAD
jgi:polyisoprenoid-binding protein YceI